MRKSRAFAYIALGSAIFGILAESLQEMDVSSIALVVIAAVGMICLIVTERSSQT
jgi:hypothetical protein